MEFFWHKLGTRCSITLFNISVFYFVKNRTSTRWPAFLSLSLYLYTHVHHTNTQQIVCRAYPFRTTRVVQCRIQRWIKNATNFDAPLRDYKSNNHEGKRSGRSFVFPVAKQWRSVWAFSQDMFGFSETPSVLLGIPWAALRGPLQNQF